MPTKTTKTTKPTKTYASVNWSNMDTEAFKLLSNVQLSVNTLAQAERQLKAAKEELKGQSKEDIRDKTKTERDHKKSCFDRATTLATMFVTRYISTEDVITGDIYHFDMVEFLKNIGVLSDGEVDKKVIDKIESIKNLVVDRYKVDVVKRRSGKSRLSGGDVKEIKNTPIELVLAIIMAAVTSKAIEYSVGGLAFVDFSKK